MQHRIIVQEQFRNNANLQSSNRKGSMTMTTAAPQEFTLHLHDDLIALVQQAASEHQESTDQVVADAIRFALQPVRREALRHLKQHIRRQQSETEPEVRRHLAARLTDEEQQRLTRLQERSKEQEPTADDIRERQQLFDRIEAVATEKAAAIWILSQSATRPDTDQ